MRAGKNLKIAIILARYNDHLGSQLLKNTLENLQKQGVQQKNISVVRVPGALEAPLMAEVLAKTKKYQALIALGVVIKGETAHFKHVCAQSYRGLMDVSLKNHLPVIFGILTVLNEKQARERIDKKRMNKGLEYAEAALEMAGILHKMKETL